MTAFWIADLLYRFALSLFYKIDPPKADLRSEIRNPKSAIALLPQSEIPNPKSEIENPKSPITLLQYSSTPILRPMLSMEPGFQSPSLVGKILTDEPPYTLSFHSRLVTSILTFSRSASARARCDPKRLKASSPFSLVPLKGLPIRPVSENSRCSIGNTK